MQKVQKTVDFFNKFLIVLFIFRLPETLTYSQNTVNLEQNLTTQTKRAFHTPFLSTTINNH
ncbi:MAG: hypothetical protein IKH45_00345 [Neisseriaceae bacterium]|nr:hypothetical protein [Neisseriaceae bacterium]MBR3481321.1 hypothetical protein [Neisseriaceae bacterium]